LPLPLSIPPDRILQRHARLVLAYADISLFLLQDHMDTYRKVFFIVFSASSFIKVVEKFYEISLRSSLS
jgi:hypothetical protein